MPDEEKKLYDTALDIVKKIAGIFGNYDLEEAAINLEEEKYKEYRNECHKLENAIIDIVKFTEKPFDFQVFSDEIHDNLFWERIENNVKRKTNGFIKLVSYRKLEENKRLELLRKTFDVVYIQRENKKFLADAIRNFQLADALFEIIQASEYIIVIMYVSKRRFREFIVNDLAIADADVEYIWTLYEQHLEIVQKIATLKNNIRLANRINSLSDTIYDLSSLLSDTVYKLSDIVAYLTGYITKDKDTPNQE